MAPSSLYFKEVIIMKAKLITGIFMACMAMVMVIGVHTIEEVIK